MVTLHPTTPACCETFSFFRHLLLRMTRSIFPRSTRRPTHNRSLLSSRYRYFVPAAPCRIRTHFVLRRCLRRRHVIKARPLRAHIAATHPRCRATPNESHSGLKSATPLEWWSMPPVLPLLIPFTDLIRVNAAMR